MPILTRWYIKSALLYLIAALSLAILMGLNNLIALPPFVSFLNPIYFHFFMLGWVSQMIFGVIYWMFPIITRKQPRGSVKLGWATYILLNMGLLLRLIGEPYVGVKPGSVWGWLLVVSALLQWLAALLFVINSWPRVKDRYRGE